MPVHYYKGRRSFKLQKAGYVKRSGFKAIDGGGNVYEVVDLHIMSASYAIRLEELVNAISGHGCVQIEGLTHEWNYYLRDTCGLAQVSASGKGLNIELFNGGTFTVSLAALRSVIYHEAQYAAIVNIPEQPAQPVWRDRRISPEQQMISAYA
jgi:hypothetical protein